MHAETRCYVKQLEAKVGELEVVLAEQAELLEGSETAQHQMMHELTALTTLHKVRLRCRHPHPSLIPTRTLTLTLMQPCKSHWNLMSGPRP